jgi:hypothetical protein
VNEKRENIGAKNKLEKDGFRGVKRTVMAAAIASAILVMWP